MPTDKTSKSDVIVARNPDAVPADMREQWVETGKYVYAAVQEVQDMPDLHERLESFPWTERLPFSRQPIIRTVQPEIVANFIDPKNLLTTAQDITPMALAYQAVELSNENNVLERALDRVNDAMHI